MHRFTYAIWTALIYLEILSYTILNQIDDITPSYLSIPVFALMLTLLIFLSFLINKFSEFKTVILASVYSVIISVFIILEIFDIVDSTFVNYGVAVTAILASFFWCVSSHYETKTDPGWHWYVFSMVFITAVCAAFNFENEPAQVVFIINAVLVVITQILYIWNVMHTQTYGNKRFRHLIRVVFVGVVSIIMIVANILKRSEIISFQSTEKIILGLEIIIGFGILIDFSTPYAIKYVQVR